MFDRHKNMVVGNSWNWGTITSNLFTVPTSSSFNNFESLSPIPTNGNTYAIARGFADITAPAIP